MKNIIYGLRDPRNDIYYYIGKSTVGNSRALSHLKKSHSDIVNEWVVEVRKNGFEPFVDIIEEVEDLNNLSDREKHWIKHYIEINPVLLNKQLKPKHINFSINEKKEVQLLDDVLPRLHILLKGGRKTRKLNQKEMANICGISLGTLKRIERGVTSVSLSHFIKYLKVFGFNMDNMLSTPNENTGIQKIDS